MPQTDSQSLINEVVDFFGRYLSCSPYQLDLLALWTFHTHSFETGPFSPALNIHSRHKQSGKTLCLELLQMLGRDTWFHTSPSPAFVVRQTQGSDHGHHFTGTLLLDDCRLTTAIQGVLSASFRWSGRQVARARNQDGESVFEQRITFFPKAFAGNQRLPACLRDISIPILLEQKSPGSPRRRFHQDDVGKSATSLRQRLSQWYKDHSDILAKTSTYEESQFPPELFSRQQDCAEPLLHIADLIGGEWSLRARHALVTAFALSAFEDFYSSKQLLTDIFNSFAAKDNPEWISTGDLLAILHAMDDRNWDEWSKGKPLTAKDLGALLGPFGVKSRNHRAGEDGKVVKGYKREDFASSWQSHVVPQLWHAAFQGSESAVAALSKNPLAASSKPEANSQEISTILVAAESQNSIPHDSGPGAVLRYQPKEASNQKPVAAVPVAAKLQDSVLPKPTAVNQKKEAAPKAVAANAKNLSSSTPKPVASSQTLMAHSVAAKLQNSLPASPKPGSVLRSQPKQASSQKLGASRAVVNGKPTVGQRIMAFSQLSPGRRKQNGLLLDSNS